MALVLRNYLRLELEKVSDPIAFRHSPSTAVLNILMQLYGKIDKQREQIAAISKEMRQKENQPQHFNLNPENIFKSVTGHKPSNIDEAMGNATVAKVLNDSKQFLIKWATSYSSVIFENTIEYP
ncbi:unnamed protein product [Gongylonema pulchrum]|uniref:Uncharacterized protein n=1 Tax=Gongylonema pulchrum TaxID=637853 RepID=A0A183EBK9_9BILA|nr:unnamed protein product [Gongylonema pulchrum]